MEEEQSMYKRDVNGSKGRRSAGTVVFEESSA